MLYCGYGYESEMGVYDVRYRKLQPVLGRWVQRDPSGYVDGANTYEYVLSAPSMRTDASGLKCCVNKVEFTHAYTPDLLKLPPEGPLRGVVVVRRSGRLHK